MENELQEPCAGAPGVVCRAAGTPDRHHMGIGFWALLEITVGALGAFCDYLMGQPQMLHQALFDSPAEPECQWAGTWGMELGGSDR